MMGKKKISVTQVMDKNADADSAKKADTKSISRVRPWELKVGMSKEVVISQLFTALYRCLLI